MVYRSLTATACQLPHSLPTTTQPASCHRACQRYTACQVLVRQSEAFNSVVGGVIVHQAANTIARISFPLANAVHVKRWIRETRPEHVHARRIWLYAGQLLPMADYNDRGGP